MANTMCLGRLNLVSLEPPPLNNNNNNNKYRLFLYFFGYRFPTLSITTRKREHVDAVKNLDVKKSALCQHVLDKDHLIDWGNVEILKRESHWHRRRVAEGFLINQKALSMNVLNRNDGMIVPSVYNVLQ